MFKTKNKIAVRKKKSPLIKSQFVMGLIMAGCGKKNNGDFTELKLDGLMHNFVPPPANFVKPEEKGPFFEVLKPQYIEPYWVQALEMDRSEDEIGEILEKNHAVMNYTFPTQKPDYDLTDIEDWRAANSAIEKSAAEIFSKLNRILETQFVEAELLGGINVIAISQNVLSREVSGYSYFPNSYFEIGSDVFISTNYSNPIYLNDNLTNYDYEVLVHEIGHALGLKHPFEEDRENKVLLSDKEDNTEHTAMSYTDDSTTFNGTFRELDFQALAKLYGVNPTYKSEDNFYSFSNIRGTFILDGNGKDTIDERDTFFDLFIDLRPGSHSFKNIKAEFITDPNQLAISHGSFVEVALAGSGNDVIVGNSLENELHGGAGNDKIFLGEGKDIVHPGTGSDSVDLSELNQSQDTIIFTEEVSGDFDLVYNFSQGDGGDVIDFSFLENVDLSLLPVIDLMNVPSGYISKHILRLSGEDISDPLKLKSAFDENGVLQELSIVEGRTVITITAESQDTGMPQNLFGLTKTDGSHAVFKIAEFLGNSMDIDMWDAHNFGILNESFIL